MKATGIVTETNGNSAVVKSTRNSACSSCHNCEARDACHVELIFGEQKQDVCVTALNKAGASVGDKVALESATDKTLFVSAFTFIIPIIISVIAYVVSIEHLSAELSAVITMVSLFFSFFITSKIMNVYAKHYLKPIITEILEESE